MSQPGARAQAVAANELYDDLLMPVHEGDRGLAVQRIAQAIQAAVKEAYKEAAGVAVDEATKYQGAGMYGHEEACMIVYQRILAAAIRQEGEPSNPTAPPLA